MLSLGGSRTGLPFHIHGETWLALIHGRKRWFVYPPGASPPAHVDQAFHPLKTVHDWFVHVYPTLRGLPQPLASLAGAPESSDPPRASAAATGALPDVVSPHGGKGPSELPAHQPPGHPGYRPLECTQTAGDILYLPAAWSHLTVNVGEAIGIGGQTALPADKRLAGAIEVLRRLGYTSAEGVLIHFSLPHLSLSLIRCCGGRRGTLRR